MMQRVGPVDGPGKGSKLMAAVQQEREVHDWEREVVDLKRQGLDTADIAAAVDKHPATIRKAIAKARERGDLPLLDETGFPLPPAEVDSEGYPVEVQTTVDDFTTTGAESGETYTATARDPLEDFRAEAGEAVGDMPPETLPEPGEAEHVLPVMPGTRQMALDLGPNAAPVFSAAVAFKSEKWPSGHFGMGDLVRGTFTARVVGIPAKEKFDKDIGEYVAAPLTYSALITEIEYEAVDPGE